MTIDITKITPEKLAEMNDSLMVDNNHLRQQLSANNPLLDEAADELDRQKAEIESLRQQLATMTADRDRLLGVMCEIAGSKSLTATPTQFYQHLQRIASDATITNPEELAATEPK